MKVTRRQLTIMGALLGVGVLLRSQRAEASPCCTVPPQGGGFAQISDLAGRVEAIAGMPGFQGFALATATRESGGNNHAANTTASEAAAARRGYERNRDGIYALNPYPPQRWGWGSGGWFGLLPSTALSAKGWERADPYLVFDPHASVAMFAAFVRNVVRRNFHRLPPEHRNWLAVRRFMSSNAHGMDWSETLEKSPRIRQRLAGDLAKRGIDPDLMYEPVQIWHWPGNIELYQALGGT